MPKAVMEAIGCDVTADRHGTPGTVGFVIVEFVLSLLFPAKLNQVVGELPSGNFKKHE